jgi:hypothetical protein
MRIGGGGGGQTEAKSSIVALLWEVRLMVKRTSDWQKIINADAETCYWLAPDGSLHPCTDDENADVRRELLNTRTISDKRRQQQIAER